jgi:NADPH:quinone reductase-like Zn-dependent oxidoreductase
METMKAARIHSFGGPDVITIDDVPTPAPGESEVLVRVAAAGVGPWDALIREHQGEVDISLPIALGSDLAGVVESVGAGVTQFKQGDEVYGATNKSFCGAYAEYAVAKADMIAVKPKSLDFLAAASVPVIGVTAWQMLFEYAQLKSGQSVLIHGGGGNVGAYAVQLASSAGLKIFATAGPADIEYVRGLGADAVIDYRTTRFEDVVTPVDAVLDTVGGDTQRRSFAVLKAGGILVSAVSPVPEQLPQPEGLRSVFFLVDVTTTRLNLLSEMFDSGKLGAQVGSVLSLEDVRSAHQMLAGAPHKRGKILLRIRWPGNQCC